MSEDFLLDSQPCQGRLCTSSSPSLSFLVSIDLANTILHHWWDRELKRFLLASHTDPPGCWMPRTKGVQITGSCFILGRKSWGTEERARTKLSQGGVGAPQYKFTPDTRVWSPAKPPQTSGAHEEHSPRVALPCKAPVDIRGGKKTRTAPGSLTVNCRGWE